MIERYPTKPESELKAKFSEKVIDDPDQIDAIIEYWFANNYRSLIQQKEKTEVTPEQKQEKIVADKATIEEAKAALKTQVTRLVMLDLQVAVRRNKTKRLRDCTGAECSKAGGWLSAIAKAIKPTDIVGKTLTEAQVRKCWRTA